MENRSLQLNNQQETTLILSDRAKEIAKVIVEVNSLSAFPKEGRELVSWANDIERLCAPEDIEKLPFLFDCFKTGKIFYDRFEGVQNIFRGFRWIEKRGDQFVVSAPFVQ